MGEWMEISGRGGGLVYSGASGGGGGGSGGLLSFLLLLLLLFFRAVSVVWRDGSCGGLLLAVLAMVVARIFLLCVAIFAVVLIYCSSLW